MNSAIKLVILLLLPLTMQAQDTIVNPRQYVPEDPESVFFSGEFYRGYSVNNSSWEKYSNLGFGLDFNWFVFPFLTFGAHYGVTYGDLKNDNIDQTGPITDITSQLIGFHVGHYYAFNREWNLHTQIGFGEVHNRSRAAGKKITEIGNNFWLQSAIGFRFDRTAAIYLKASLRRDRMKIDAPRELDDYFNKHSLLMLGFGVRLHLQNPGG